MKKKSSSLHFVLLSFKNVAEGTPQFKRIECKWNDETGKKYDLCLEVDYGVDKASDVALLSKVDNLNTVFWGQMLNETTKVAASIEDLSSPDDIEVLWSCIILKR